MEGFQEAMDKIKKQLLDGSSYLDIISIVGVSGIEKTIFAEKIYNDLIATLTLMFTQSVMRLKYIHGKSCLPS
ncbi:hypothetical protein KY285_023479 [Solanum tuberosum]|nr:hypothetical protein KY289_023810 [Solanum tuberosum]KAH0675678.1 hypothetical protein KY285_023479 [Solanum tuberosum]